MSSFSYMLSIGIQLGVVSMTEISPISGVPLTSIEKVAITIRWLSWIKSNSPTTLPNILSKSFRRFAVIRKVLDVQHRGIAAPFRDSLVLPNEQHHALAARAADTGNTGHPALAKLMLALLIIEFRNKEQGGERGLLRFFPLGLGHQPAA